MSAIDVAVRSSKRLETLLESRYGAAGKGLHEKVSSVQDKLPDDLVQSIRKIATIRNRAVHEDGFEIEDEEGFRAEVWRVEQALDDRHARGAAPSRRFTGSLFTKSSSTTRTFIRQASFILLLLVGYHFVSSPEKPPIMPFSDFISNVRNGNVEAVVIQTAETPAEFRYFVVRDDARKKYFSVGLLSESLQAELLEHNVRIEYEQSWHASFLKRAFSM